jgi:hypothetical protein
LAHRLTGWNAIQKRCKQLGLDLTDDELRAVIVYDSNDYGLLNCVICGRQQVLLKTWLMNNL